MRQALNLNTLCLLFIALGIITRIAIYIYNPNFWGDEVGLAQSIIFVSVKEILQGNLLACQAAPLGFILSVKALSFGFGYSEYVLRLIPLLAGILVFPIAYTFAIREFDKKFACVFLFFLTISLEILFYSIQFKQYATEVLVSLIYLNSFCQNRKIIIEKGKIPLSLALIAPIGMLFSNASIFVLAGIFCYMLFEQWEIKQLKLFLYNSWLKILIVAVFLACYYFLWLTQIQGIKSGVMNDYWKSYYPGDIKSVASWGPFVLKNMLGYFIDISRNVYLNCALFTSLFFFGLVFLFREKRYMLFAIIIGIIFYITAYFFGKYPLSMSDNFSTTSILKMIGCRSFVHFFPIVLIVPSFAVYKLLESVKFRKLALIILIAMPCIAFYFSWQKINSGLEFARISEIVETIEDENSAVVMNATFAPSYFYYQFLKGKKNSEAYLIYEPVHIVTMEYFEFPGYSTILIKANLPMKNIFDELKSEGKKKVYFMFSKSTSEAISQGYLCYLYAKNNFPEKTSIYEGNGFKAILVELE
jgi:hypothetical protein